MKFSLGISLIVFASLLGGCNPSIPSGSGGNSTTTTSQTTTTNGGAGGTTMTNGGTGGGGFEDVVLGPSDNCTGVVSFGPISSTLDAPLVNVPLVDESGSPIYEDGALACKLVIPPAIPFTFTSWELSWGGDFPPDAVSFLGPKNPVFPFVLEDGNHLTITSLGNNPDPTVTISLTETISDKETGLYVCARLGFDGENRSNVKACHRKDGSSNPNILYSNTTNGLVSPLPDVDLEQLQDSPTPALAMALGNGPYEWAMVVHGHH